MPDTRLCPKCGSPIPSGSPVGLCPKCLLGGGIDSQSEADPNLTPTRASAPSGTASFVPPGIEELAGHFPQLEILELLGKGGMGAVYKARQRGLDRLVAVKILPPEIGHDAAFAERFTREARALARLSHSHIVSVYDFGQTPTPLAPSGRGAGGEGALFYIVMEFVDGANLRQTIQGGKLTSAEALAIVPQICEALQFAHDEGIVHRDIKPENILIDKRGRVKIADFGLAKLLGTDASDHSLTATHQVMGTLRYMAPEQMQGSREVDHRADIYSLGVVFYELLTGELPMGKFAPPSKKVQVDVRLDEVVLRALEQDPEQRYQHASDVKVELESIRTTPAPVAKAAAQPDPLDGLRNAVRFATTPNPRYGKRVGLPTFLLFVLWLAATIAVHVVYGQKDNYQEGPILLVQGGGMVLFGLIVFVMHLVFLIRECPREPLPNDSALSSNDRDVERTAANRDRVWKIAKLCGWSLACVVAAQVIWERGGWIDMSTWPHEGSLTYRVALASKSQSFERLVISEAMTFRKPGGNWFDELGPNTKLPKEKLAEFRLDLYRGGDVHRLHVRAASDYEWNYADSTGDGPPWMVLEGREFGNSTRNESRVGPPASASMLKELFADAQCRLTDREADVLADRLKFVAARKADIRSYYFQTDGKAPTGLLGWAFCDASQGDAADYPFEITMSERATGFQSVLPIESVGRPVMVLVWLAGLAVLVSRWSRRVATASESQLAAEFVESEPRLSRCALVGAIWSPLFFVAFLMTFVSMRSRSYVPGEYTGPAWWQLALMFTLLPLGALAPFGTTILGAIGITKIKRSEGKLYGLRLAQADALLFPLLLLAGVAGFVAMLIVLTAIKWGIDPQIFDKNDLPHLLIVVMAVPIWFFPARALFRAVVGPRDAFELGKFPVVGNEPPTGKGALVVALAAIAAHGWPWHWIISPPPSQRSMTISNFDVIDALQSFWLLVLSIGLALFASAASLAKPAKIILRVASIAAAIAALVIQVQFYRSLGEWESGQVGQVARLIRTYSHTAVYVAMALTGLVSLFLLLRLFDEPSSPTDAESVRRPIGPEQISLWAAISGVLLPALLLIGGTALSSRDSIPDRFVVLCFLPGVGLELVAFGCGLVARGTKSGKAGLIISSISLVLCPIPLTIPLRTIPTRDSTADPQPKAITESGTVTRTPKVGAVNDAPSVEELFTLKGHTGYVYNVRFSPDGTRIASASHDGTAKVWNAETGVELFTCRGHTDYVHGLAYNSDGTRLGTTSQDGSVRIWDAATGDEKLRLTDRGVSNLAFSPNGERVASAGINNKVEVWNATTGEEIMTLKGDDNSVFFNVAYSPDGKWISASGMDGAVWLWDAATGREADIHRNAISNMLGVAFDRESKRIAACSRDGHVRVWDVLTGELLFFVVLVGDSPLSAAFSPDGKWLANGTTNGDIRIWHATNEAPTYMPGHYREALTIKAHPRLVKSVVFNHDGSRLASGSDDKTVKVWKVTPRNDGQH